MPRAVSAMFVGSGQIRFISELQLLLLFAIGAYFLTTRATSATRAAELLGTFAERYPTCALVALLTLSYVIAFLTTPRIGFGRGQLGVGYGHDGMTYGWMTEHGPFTGEAVPSGAPHVHRILAPLLVRWSGLDTFSGFASLNAVGYVAASVFLYGSARGLGLSRRAALLAVALFSICKFGLKFWLYYPVLPDGLATAAFIAILYATVTGHEVLYLTAMAVGVLCREDVLLMSGFYVLHSVRTGTWRTQRRRILLLQVPPFVVFALVREFPPFVPALNVNVLRTAVNTAQAVLADPVRGALSFINALGVLVVVPLLLLRRVGRFFWDRYEWLYCLLVMSTAALFRWDVDRLVLWCAPILALAELSACGDLTNPRTRRAWSALFLLQLVAMEFVLPWFPDEAFYLARSATHAGRDGYVGIAASSGALALIIIVLAYHARLSSPPTHRPPSSALPA
jgi:hypothetical protein